MKFAGGIQLLLVTLAHLCQSTALLNLHQQLRRKECRQPLRSSVIDELTVQNEEDIIGQFASRRTVPVANTAGMNITAANFFGRQVLSTAECKTELIGLLTNRIEIEKEFMDYRVEYLTKYLEYKYIPIQTTPFLNFALTGEWDMLYSNILTPRADESLEFEISQEIVPNEIFGSPGGVLNNVINWKLNRADDQSSGNLMVKCEYLFNTKGDLDVTLVEHVLIPKNESPKDIEDLIMSIQRSIPFESFDPDNIRMQNTVRYDLYFHY